jgi:TorA maturation chaperone TorD
MVAANHHVYSLFAEGLAPPSREWVRAWNAGEVLSELRHIFEISGFLSGLSLLERLPNRLSLKETAKQYAACFVIPGPQRILPVESVYKRWTVRSGSTLSMSGEKGYLMGDSAVHMKWLYDSLHLELPTEFESIPDHLLLLLEFASLLEQTGNFEFKHSFAREHLDWLEVLVAEAATKGWTGLYMEWLRLIESYVRWDMSKRPLPAVGRG